MPRVTAKTTKRLNALCCKRMMRKKVFRDDLTGGSEPNSFVGLVEKRMTILLSRLVEMTKLLDVVLRAV